MALGTLGREELEIINRHYRALDLFPSHIYVTLFMLFLASGSLFNLFIRSAKILWKPRSPRHLSAGCPYQPKSPIITRGSKGGVDVISSSKVHAG